MTTMIKPMTADEIALIAGGVTEGPDGQGCTQPTPPILRPLPDGSGLWGGPAIVQLFP